MQGGSLLPAIQSKRTRAHTHVSSCRLDNAAGTGIHFGPSGIELDEALQLGQSTQARLGGSLYFPRQLPLAEGDGLHFNVHRLGIKTTW